MIKLSMVFVIAIAFIVGLALPLGEAYGTEHEPTYGKNIAVCYAWDLFPNERFKLSIKAHSSLSEEDEGFGHAAYSVLGKEVGGCGGDTILAVDGTVVTGMLTRATKGPTRAQMGIVAHASRGDGAFLGDEFCRSFILDCTTQEHDPAPARWRCQSRNDFDIYHGASNLRRVDATLDPRCSIPENGGEELTERGAAPIGPASGLKPVKVGGPMPDNGSFSIVKVPVRPADIKICCFGDHCEALGHGDTCPFSTWTCAGETETHWTGCTCTKHCGDQPIFHSDRLRTP